VCRLFGAISSNEIDAQALILRAPRSLLRQSTIDRKRKQGDGWGIGWFEGSKPKIFKSPEPMYRDRNRVERAARQAKGKVLIGHVRWASNPLKLKRSELIGLSHTQPFTYSGWTFAHNGTLFIPKEVAAQLGPWKKHIKGKNDSEVLFYWLLKHLKNSKNPASGVRSALKGLSRVWDTCKKSYPIHKYPYHGLNWVLSDGKTLLAFCYADPRGFGKAKALGNRREPYYLLRRRITDDTMIVASEPMDSAGSWQGFRHGELVIAQRQGKRLMTRKVQVC
jgi:predicted glutamine amidotransferase